jgi:hypothetical protein
MRLPSLVNLGRLLTPVTDEESEAVERVFAQLSARTQMIIHRVRDERQRCEEVAAELGMEASEALRFPTFQGPTK